MKILKKDKQGITLIELLVVLAIISILALIAYTSLSGAREEARRTSVKASMNDLAPAAELYALGKGFSYQGFCNSGITNEINKSCRNIYGGTCVCTCQNTATTWEVRCTAGDFTWACENTGTRIYCHQ